MAVAAMEPTDDRREHGSQVPGGLSCGNSMSCERLANVGARHHSVDLSRCEQHVLTWVLVLPGIRVTISALASQMMTVVDEGSFSIRAGTSSGTAAGITPDPG